MVFRFLLALLLCVLILVGTGLCLILNAQVADPVVLRLVELPIHENQNFEVSLISAGGKELFFREFLPGSPYRVAYDVWIKQMQIKVPQNILTKADHLEVKIGDETFRFPTQEIARKGLLQNISSKNPAAGPDLLFVFPDDFGRNTVFFEGKKPGLNWPGDGPFIRATIRYSFFPMVLGFLIVFILNRRQTWQGRDWLAKVIGLTGEPKYLDQGKNTQEERLISEEKAGVPGQRDSVLQLLQFRFWNWIGFIFLISMMVMLEHQMPYYFTKDDNVVGSLPVILFACRSLWEGMFPHYNPFWYLGGPLASLGLYSLTYPPVYFSYGIARHVLGDEYATLEVFALLHFVTGFFLTRYLARKIGLGALVANLVSLSFVLSGALLIMGRCWHNWVPVVVWQPILCLGLLRLQQQPVSWKWVLGIGLALGLPFHVGFSQMAIYCAGFFSLGVLYLLAVQTISWQRALLALPALIVGAGLALPLVYQQFRVAETVSRPAESKEGLARKLPAMLLPYPIIQEPHPARWGNQNIDLMGHVFFFGGLFSWLFFLQMVGLTLLPRDQRNGSQHVWTFCAFIALWMGLGDYAGLWKILSELPVLSLINRHAFRVMPFFVLFAVLAGGKVLEHILRLSTKKQLATLIVSPVAFALLFWHVSNCRVSFYTYQITPYPELPEKIQQAFWQEGKPTGRTSSWAKQRSSDSNYALLLPLNIATFYQVPSLDGYDPLIGGMKKIKNINREFYENPKEVLKAYGVRWHLFHTPDRLPPLSSPYQTTWFFESMSKNEWAAEQLAPETLPLHYEGEGLTLRELPGVDFLAFPLNNPKQSFPLLPHAHGMDVDISSMEKPSPVVINFLAYPEMTVTVDGTPVPHLTDEWRRIVVNVPSKGQHLSVRYIPPWGMGIFLGSILVGMGFILMYLLRRNLTAPAA